VLLGRERLVSVEGARSRRGVVNQEVMLGWERLVSEEGTRRGVDSWEVLVRREKPINKAVIVSVQTRFSTEWAINRKMLDNERENDRKLEFCLYHPIRALDIFSLSY
jgi:hypothetical protein